MSKRMPPEIQAIIGMLKSMGAVELTEAEMKAKVAEVEADSNMSSKKMSFDIKNPPDDFDAFMDMLKDSLLDDSDDDGEDNEHVCDNCQAISEIQVQFGKDITAAMDKAREGLEQHDASPETADLATVVMLYQNFRFEQEAFKAKVNYATDKTLDILPPGKSLIRTMSYDIIMKKKKSLFQSLQAGLESVDADSESYYAALYAQMLKGKGKKA